MESGEVFTPLSDITGTGAKVEKPQQAARSLPATTADPDKAKKIGQIHFKASHGILTAFFTFMLYVV